MLQCFGATMLFVVNLVATVLSAVAATTAAILTGVHLYLSRRQEEVRWARQALIETFGLFLDASFRSKDSVKRAYKISRSAADRSQIASLKREAEEAEEEMRVLQTRIRLLGSAEVIEAAQALRTGVREYLAILDQPVAVPAALDEDLRQMLWDRRYRFIAAAKEALSI